MEIGRDTRIYIAGCGGMLGDAVYKRFSPKCSVEASDIDQNTPWLRFGDVRDYKAIRASIIAFKPAAILNLAALTDLEDCEKRESDSWATNALGAENLGLVAQELDVPYVYISTAGIFDGRKDSYHDFDEPNPLSVYGKSKFHGERYVTTRIKRHFVIRAGWMMGGGPFKDKKFINKIYKQLLAGKTTLEVVDDKHGTPTYTHDFAAGIERLLASDQYGLYNQVCSGEGSRYDVAVEFIRLLGLADRVTVKRVSSERFSKEYFAVRPRSEALFNMKLNARGLNVMRGWRLCLAEYVAEFPPIPQAQQFPSSKDA